MKPLDASQSQPLSGGPSFSLANRAYRAGWQLAWLLLARWTPPMLNGWRCWLLRLFGARIAPGAHVRSSAVIWAPANLIVEAGGSIGPGAIIYNMAPITIGARAIVSQRAHLCAGSHDIEDPHFQLVARPIVIGADAWVAAEAFVGPGVVVGEGAVLGARGCAFSDLDAWGVYGGNPAKLIRRRAKAPGAA
ncbi:putative colanic acid biosynthesis acetyltransferase [Sphingomonas sp. GlSt437]|uniref:putative colanic acid biosynthesis acetyltransferase n=1 Tax=Sphingomonas sp. GlSt437 TaxID=3389970 RepID=UPI003A8BC93D